MRETACEPSLNGVALKIVRHDWDRVRCTSCGSQCGGADCEKQVDLPTDQISGETREGLRLSARESDIERNVLAFDVAKVSQTLSCLIGYSRSGAKIGVQHSHHWHLALLLCGDSERQREEATCNAANERSPVHCFSARR